MSLQSSGIAAFRIFPHIWNLFPQGFLADTLGSYAPSFYLAGGVLLLCAVLPFVLLCPVEVKKENDESDQEMIAMEEDGQTQNVTAL